MPDEEMTRIRELAAAEARIRAWAQEADTADARRLARRAATDLAEAIDQRLYAGQAIEEIAPHTGRDVEALAQLLATERERVSTRQRNRDRKQALMRGEIASPHGGLAGNAVAGCKCGPCTAARKYKRAWNVRRREVGLLAGDPRHGTVTGYCYGCRCDRCSHANAEHLRRWAARNPPRRRTRRPA